MRIARFRAGAALLLAVALPLAACGGSPEESQGGEVVITCSVCQPYSDTDAIGTYRADLVKRFNEANAGRYQVKVIPNIDENTPEGVQQLSRLALVDDLPDLFFLGELHLVPLDESAGLMDFRPRFEADTTFRDTFFPEMLRSPRGLDRLLAVPDGRNVLGVFWNEQILAEAGVARPPTSYPELLQAAAAIRAAGKIPLAMDGLFVTLNWLAHLIGTQPGGADYLGSGDLLAGGLENNPLWVTAVERLKELHTSGFVNEDAFTGQFDRASQPFLSGDAAAMANGPWYAPVISSETAEPGLAEAVTYVSAPGNGVAISGRGSGWASGAREAAKQDAVWAFVKFAYAWPEQVTRSTATAAFPPVRGEFDTADRKKLNPLALELHEASEAVANVYPLLDSMPQSMWDEWDNYWPAYVQGSMDTRTFLARFNK
ncbi:ABC transporter substrate-binding protein [Phytohabitans kaempferiae]|uniref:ABC transporter substrate-binding protein n=1 Tax=Phytohabitans kaempferiae TaxID=1620943 RepID=A0ABV6MAL9_9ACTN